MVTKAAAEQLGDRIDATVDVVDRSSWGITWRQTTEVPSTAKAGPISSIVPLVSLAGTRGGGRLFTVLPSGPVDARGGPGGAGLSGGARPGPSNADAATAPVAVEEDPLAQARPRRRRGSPSSHADLGWTVDRRRSTAGYRKSSSRSARFAQPCELSCSNAPVLDRNNRR